MHSSSATTVTALQRCAILALAMVLLPGCFDIDYVLPALVGQLELITGSVPLEEALTSDTLSDQQISKLELIIEVRDYAGEQIGLAIDNNFTLFYDAGGEPVAYNLSAARKDALEPYEWWFPVIGTIPYLGFFDLSAAEDREADLQAQDYDTFRYAIDAYSLGTWFPNPVLSPMLERGDIALVDTVFHELLHGTMWSQDTNFNESLATWVGRTATLEYFAVRFPDEPERLQRVIDAFDDADRFSTFMLQLIEELEDFYASDRTAAEKIAEREAIFEAARLRFAEEVRPLLHFPEAYAWVETMPTNNAYILSFQRYHLQLDVFEAVFDAVDRQWPVALSIFRDATAQPEPYGFLEQWLPSASTVQ